MRSNMLLRSAMALLCAVTVVIGQASLTPWRPASAQAQSTREEAKRHFAEGSRLYQAGDYRGAIAEYEAAERLAPAPLNDYNVALCYDRLGDGAQALARYRNYLNRAPSAPNRGSVESRITELDAAARADAGRKAEAADAARKAEEAQKAAAAAAATKPAEAAPPDAQVGGVVGEPAGEPGGGQAEAAPPPASTGDPDLDRAAAIDVAAIRDARVAPTGGGSADGAHERFGQPPRPGVPQAEAAPPPVADATPKSKPLYKQWWFWVVVGVSAFIVIDILSSDASSNTRAVQGPPRPNGATGTAGATIFTF